MKLVLLAMKLLIYYIYYILKKSSFAAAIIVINLCFVKAIYPDVVSNGVISYEVMNLLLFLDYNECMLTPSL